jgi:CrcB protein
MRGRPSVELGRSSGQHLRSQQGGTAVTWLAVALGGAAGACLRFSFSRAFAAWSTGIPLGTLAANVVACFLLGSLTGAGVSGVLPQALLAAGVAGGLSTFSTLMYETLAALQEGDTLVAGVNLGANLAGGLLAFGLGAVLWRHGAA